MIYKICKQCNVSIGIEGDPSQYPFRRPFKDKYQYFCSADCLMEFLNLQEDDKVLITKSGIECHTKPKVLCENCVKSDFFKGSEDFKSCPLVRKTPTASSVYQGYYYCNFKVEA